MIKKILSTIMLSSLLMNTTVYANESTQETDIKKLDFKNLTNEQKADLGLIVKQYLVENPEFLFEASQRLQEKQMESQIANQNKAVIENVDKILNNDDTPKVGPKDAKLVVVEFFDYNCVYCTRSAAEVEKLIENNKDVQFIFKDMPIFAGETPSSKYAAQMGMKIYKEKGQDAYYKYHNDVFSVGKKNGSIKIEDIDKLGNDIGVEKIKDNEFEEQVQSSLNLSRTLRFVGTPTFVFMPSENQNLENTKVLMRSLSYEDMNEILKSYKENNENNITK